MVHQGCGFDDPGISAFRLGVAPFLGAINPAFLLGLADEHHALWPLELLALLFGKVILALSLLEGNQRNSVVFGKLLDGTDKLARDRLHHVSGGHFMPAVDPYELQCAVDRLELGHTDVEVHPIDALHF